MKSEEQTRSIAQIYALGRERLKEQGVSWEFPPDSVPGRTIAANRDILNSLFFVPKYLDPVEVSTEVSIFGKTLKSPIFGSPISKAHFMAETDLTDIARGIRDAGSLMMVGLASSKQLSYVVDTGVPVVKIIKPYRRIELVHKELQEAERLGCVAVGIDIDHSYGSLRGHKNIWTKMLAPLTKETLKSVVASTKLPFIVKGVLSRHDAEKAVELGASAVLVSTHGKSALDFNIPTMAALPEIAAAVGDRMTVIIDGGFKTGNDVVKALAFGAKAVGFANSLLLARAAEGSAEVKKLFNLISAEIRRTMAITGCKDLGEVDRSIIKTLPFYGIETTQRS